MGNVRQKKKRKNQPLVLKSKRKNGLLKNGRKKINILNNPIISNNWDKKLTLTQNYRRLGLISRLGAPTGGTEKSSANLANETCGDGNRAHGWDPLHSPFTAQKQSRLKLAEARVERDPETGKILRVIPLEGGIDEETIIVAGKRRRKENPLGDPLVELSATGTWSTETPTTSAAAEEQKRPRSGVIDIVRQLEEQALREGEALKKKKPRQQSKREVDWIERLVEQYGDNFAAMSRDRKLNPMQQTEADIRRRARKWHEQKLAKTNI